MILKTAKTLRAAHKAVTRLVEECRKNGPIYVRDPQSVAQVSRTGKWLLNAIAKLRRELNISGIDEPRQTN